MGWSAILSAGGAMALIALSFPVSASGPTVPTPAELLAGPCATCHGQDGKSPGSIVALHGRPAKTLAELLELYRTKELTGTVMNRIVAGYTPEQLRAIADHLGTKE